MTTPILQCLWGLVGALIAIALICWPKKEEAPTPCQFVYLEDEAGHRGFVRLALSKFDKLKAHLTVPGKHLQGVR